MDSNTTSLNLTTSNTFKMPTSGNNQNSQQDGTNYGSTSSVVELKTTETEYTFEELLQVADKGIESNLQDDGMVVTNIKYSLDALMKQEQNFADPNFCKLLEQTITAYKNASGNQKTHFETKFPEQYAYFLWVSNEYINNFLPVNELIARIKILGSNGITFTTDEYIDEFILDYYKNLTPEQRKYLPENFGIKKEGDVYKYRCMYEEGSVISEVESLMQDISSIEAFGEQMYTSSEKLFGKNNDLSAVIYSLLGKGEDLEDLLNKIILESESQRGTVYALKQPYKIKELQNKSVEEKFSLAIGYIMEEIINTNVLHKDEDGNVKEINVVDLYSFLDDLERFFNYNSYGRTSYGKEIIIGENKTYLTERSKSFCPQFMTIYNQLKKTYDYYSDLARLYQLYGGRSVFPAYQDKKVKIETEIEQLEKKLNLEHNPSFAEQFQADPGGTVLSCSVAFICGLLDIGEGIIDFIIYGGGHLCAGTIGLIDSNAAEQIREATQSAIEYDMTGALYVGVMEWANVDEDTYNNSVAGVLQAGGKIAGFAALTIICPVAAPVISATALAGSAIEEAFLNGATFAEAGVIGAVTWTTSYYCGNYLNHSTSYIKGMAAAVIEPFFTSTFEYLCYMDHVDENGNHIYKSLWDYYEKDGTYMDASLAALFAIWEVRGNRKKAANGITTETSGTTHKTEDATWVKDMKQKLNDMGVDSSNLTLDDIRTKYPSVYLEGQDIYSIVDDIYKGKIIAANLDDVDKKTLFNKLKQYGFLSDSLSPTQSVFGKGIDVFTDPKYFDLETGRFVTQNLTEADKITLYNKLKESGFLKGQFPIPEELFVKYIDVYTNPTFCDITTGRIRWPGGEGAAEYVLAKLEAYASKNGISVSVTNLTETEYQDLLLLEIGKQKGIAGLKELGAKEIDFKSLKGETIGRITTNDFEADKIKGEYFGNTTDSIASRELQPYQTENGVLRRFEYTGNIRNGQTIEIDGQKFKIGTGEGDYQVTCLCTHTAPFYNGIGEAEQFMFYLTDSKGNIITKTVGSQIQLCKLNIQQLMELDIIKYIDEVKVR